MIIIADYTFIPLIIFFFQRIFILIYVYNIYIKCAPKADTFNTINIDRSQNIFSAMGNRNRCKKKCNRRNHRGKKLFISRQKSKGKITYFGKWEVYCYR